MSWLARHRRLAFAAICTFWTAVVFVGHFFPTLPFISIPWRGEQGFEDLLRTEGRKTATRDDFIFLGIDQQSLQLDAVGPEEIAGNRAFELMTERPFPWSREIWVLLLDRLFGAGARLVIFDLVFNNPNDGDPAFRAALDRYHARVVVGMNIDTQNNTQIVLPNTQLIPPPAPQAGAAAPPATMGGAVYEFEPDEGEILADLLPRNLTVQIFRVLLENAASFYC